MNTEIAKAKIGVIGGSGLYQIEGIENVREINVDTPFGLPSDNLIIGELSGVSIAFIPRHGRGHYLVPSGVNYRANIFAMKKLGVETIISASAVGSMREDIAPGDIVIVDQYFDRTKNRPFTFFGNGMVVHISFSDPVCGHLAGQLTASAREEGVTVHEKGTYICMEGPQFSTLGESRIYREWGVDVIGMTALPEAKLAREAEICYATMALVTDYDCWYEGHDAVSVDMVVKQLMLNADNAKKILARAIGKIASETAEAVCGCRSALRNAMMTSPEKIDSRMKEELNLLIGKYINE